MGNQGLGNLPRERSVPVTIASRAGISNRCTPGPSRISRALVTASNVQSLPWLRCFLKEYMELGPGGRCTCKKPLSSLTPLVILLACLQVPSGTTRVAGRRPSKTDGSKSIEFGPGYSKSPQRAKGAMSLRSRAAPGLPLNRTSELFSARFTSRPVFEDLPDSFQGMMTMTRVLVSTLGI